jgi:hypothetical protein
LLHLNRKSDEEIRKVKQLTNLFIVKERNKWYDHIEQNKKTFLNEDSNYFCGWGTKKGFP